MLATLIRLLQGTEYGAGAAGQIVGGQACLPFYL
jgi:hypothetical protein